ncbi:hypothetical protein [Enterococcus mundtii]|uniref:hypothetical protein n=1 Tax=Enterococcus mundtii TaxID=53346 RepID=UPI002DBD02EA|nr:hypothetical protein [Enterococcus mundtii]MEC3942281.1 hypothetical protein [Enterococcus mundtii]
MSKTDKELTIELLKDYLTAWHDAERTSPVKFDELQKLIKQTYETIKSLPEEK